MRICGRCRVFNYNFFPILMHISLFKKYIFEKHIKKYLITFYIKKILIVCFNYFEYITC